MLQVIREKHAEAMQQGPPQHFHGGGGFQPSGPNGYGGGGPQRYGGGPPGPGMGMGMGMEQQQQNPYQYQVSPTLTLGARMKVRRTHELTFFRNRRTSTPVRVSRPLCLLAKRRLLLPAAAKAQERRRHRLEERPRAACRTSSIWLGGTRSMRRVRLTTPSAFSSVLLPALSLDRPDPASEG